MRKNYFDLFVFFSSIALLVSLVNANVEISHSNDAKEFLKSVNQKLELVFDEYVALEDDFASFSDQTEERQAELKDFLVKFRNIFINIESERKSFMAWENLDADTRHALSELRNVGGVLNVGVDFVKFISNVNILDQIVYEENGTLSDNSEALFNVDLHDLERTKKNWQTLHDKLGSNADQLLFQTIETVRTHAKEFDLDPLAFWFPDTTLDSIAEIDQIMIDLKPFYAQLHALVRHKLKQQFGEEVISESGRIPEHLYKNMQFNVWNDQTFAPRNEASSAVKSYQDIFDSLHYNASTLIELAENFYTSLGFKELSEETKTKNIVESEEDSLYVYPGSVYGHGTNVTLYYSNRTDLEAFGVYHSLLWHLYNGQLHEQLPRYFWQDYEFGIAFGIAMKLSALSKSHLKNIGIRNVEETNAIALDINARLAISTLFLIMYQYAEFKILVGLFSGNISKSEVNAKYWQLMAEYAGVEAPVVRESQSLEIPYSFYATATQFGSLTKKFATNFLSYQFYEAICDKISHKDALSDCDFYGNKDVGKLLNQILSLGTSKPYTEILSMILEDKPKTNVNALLEYFAPTRSMITELKLTTGWKEHL